MLRQMISELSQQVLSQIKEEQPCKTGIKTKNYLQMRSAASNTPLIYTAHISLIWRIDEKSRFQFTQYY